MRYVGDRYLYEDNATPQALPAASAPAPGEEPAEPKTGEPEADRQVTPVFGKCLARHRDDPFQFSHSEGQTFSRGRGEDHSVDG